MCDEIERTPLATYGEYLGVGGGVLGHGGDGGQVPQDRLLVDVGDDHRQDPWYARQHAVRRRERQRVRRRALTVEVRVTFEQQITAYK